MRRVASQSTSNFHLLERILSFENVQAAWKRVRANRGAPGIDKVSVNEFPERFRSQWGEIRKSVLAGTYLPQPVKRVEIPKASGGTRPLGIPTVLDRLIQQSMALVLGPVFEPGFSNSSYGFRPGRSAHGAVRQARELIRQGYRIAVDTDLAKFFDSVDHDVLMSRVARKIRDKGVLRLIGSYLRAGVSVNGRLQRSIRGVPQGGPLSPLLANILLDDFDKELERRGLRFVRYADDFLILVKSLTAGERVASSTRRFLERKLKVAVNEKKSRVGPTDETEFLGFTFKKTRIIWSDKVYQEFRRRVRKLTGRSWGISMDARMRKIREYIGGWMNYFGISELYNSIPEIDHWLRRRIRMCYWKQWRHRGTRIRLLLSLGTFRKEAVRTGLSRKGPWHLARTLATQSGMTNKWLADQGLVVVKDLWVNMHYPATAR